MTRRLGPGAAALAAALFAAACAGGGTPAPAASQPAAASAASGAAGCQVVPGGTGTAAEIKSFTFPTGVSVKAGESVAWTNGDSASHTVTFDDGTCSSGQIPAGTTVVVQYDTPGTHAFHCEIHASMKGTIVVQ